MKRHIAAVALLASGAMTSGWAEEAAPAVSGYAGNTELAEYLEESAEQHPRLRALHEEWRAAMERIPQVTALDDPMFGYTQFIRSDMDQFSVMLEQRLPWFGTLKLRGEQALEQAEAVRWQLFDERNLLYSIAKSAYFDYAFIFEQLGVIQEQLELLQFAEDLILSQYELGLATQDMSIQLEQQRSQLEDLRAQLTQMQDPVRAALNEALGRPVDAALPPPAALDPPPAPPAAERLTAWIRRRNPRLEARQREVESLETGVALAERARYPEFNFRIEYMGGREPGRMGAEPYMPGRLMSARSLLQGASGRMPLDTGMAIDAYELFRYKEPMGDKDNALAVTMELSLPIWRKKLKALTREAEHRVQGARYDHEAMAREIDRDARTALFNMQDGLRRHRLFAEVLAPKERQAYAALEAGYASGTAVEYTEMIESRRQLLEFELEALRALRDWRVAAAELEYLVGGDWREAGTETEGTEEAEVGLSGAGK